MATLRILHLEDEPHFADLVVSLFREGGLACEVVRVSTRQEFEDALQEGSFELVLSDHSLPGYDGLSALAHCRRRHPTLPFVFLSGTLGEELAVDCLKKGASDYVLKSNLGRLLPTVRRTLEAAREARNHRQAQERIRRDQFNLRALIENTGDAVFSVDLDFQVLAYNSAASLLSLKICGHPLQMGSSFVEPMAPEERERWQGILDRVRKRERVFEERTLAWKNGTDFVHITCSPILFDHGVVGMAVFVQDVTEAKRIREAMRQAKLEAEEANKAKGQFLANMSHEIRTPMNGLVVMSRLLADTALDSRQAHYVNVIRTSAESLLTVINDILDFSRIERGHLRLEHRPFDLRETVADAIALFEPGAQEKGLDLKWSFESGVPSRFFGDPGRLRQVLVNLLGNALKFTERGAVKLRVSSGRTGERFLLRFEVEDTGVGIPSDRGDLFQAFSQSDASNTRRHGGAGLGLAISKQLAELMGGDIGYASRPGRGSAFWFTARLVPASEEAGKPRFPALRSRPTAPLRILVAEDNPINQMVIAGLLEKLGYTARVVADGVQACEACRSEPFDVVFMDCQMPELDGYAATAKIRRLKGRRPFIVAMTADALLGAREKCLRAGMDGYISKPILQEALQDVLERVSEGQLVPDPAGPGSAPDLDNAGAVDMRIVNRLRVLSGGGKGGDFRKMVGEFLREGKRKIRVLKKLLAERDDDGLAKTAHALKGLSLNFGAMAMARECEALQRADFGRGADLGAILARLEKQMEIARSLLEAQIAPGPRDAPAPPGRRGA